MRLDGLFRYPVKSMGGESCATLQVAARGIDGDRFHAVRTADGKFGSGKTTRRFRHIPGLLEFESFYDGTVPVLRFPDGRVLRGDAPGTNAELSLALGQPVELAPEAAIAHMDDAPVHVLTSAALRWLQAAIPDAQLDVARFRPNLLLLAEGEGPVEHAWINRRLSIGDVVLEITHAAERCVMTSAAQKELPHDPRILKHIAQQTGGVFGVYAKVVSGGTVCRGDEALL
jgi:uncharacterized protein YcbX